MTTPTPNNRPKYYIILFAIGCLAAMMLWSKCGKEKERVIPDNYKAAYEAERKHFGYKQAQFEKELAIRDKADKTLRAENIALRERTETAEGNYNKLLSRIKQSAPNDCQPYIG